MNARLSLAAGLLLGLASWTVSFPEDVVIRGAVRNPAKTTLVIDGELVKLEAGGGFRFVRPLTGPAYLEVSMGKTFALYVRPGDEVMLALDAAAAWPVLEVGGGLHAVNEFLVRQAEESDKTTRRFATEFRAIVSLDEKGYSGRIAEIVKPFEDALAAFLRGSQTVESYFETTQRAVLRYSRASLLLKYPGWHREVTGKWSFSPSEDFFAFLAPGDFDRPEMLALQEYRAFLSDYLNARADAQILGQNAFEGRNYRPIRAKMKVILDTPAHPQVRGEMLRSFFPVFIRDHQHKGIDDLVAAFRDLGPDKDMLEAVERSIEEDRKVRERCLVRTYKMVQGADLDVFVFAPPGLRKGERRPAVAFFHGGGWDAGKPEWGATQGEHFASLGLVGLSFEYRLATQHGATPIESMADAASALRWIRRHADELGVDPGRVAASGYSAGGHLALMTAMSEKFYEPGEDRTIRAAPDALILWVAPAKIFPGWFTNLIRGRARLEDCDPYLLVRPGLPPAVMFQGTADDTVPAWTAEAFAKKMTAAGNRCDLHLYPGQTHLNWSKNIADVLRKMDDFLRSVGFLEARGKGQEGRRADT